MHYFINKNVPGMVATVAKIRTSNEHFFYCTPEQVWIPSLKKFMALGKRSVKKLPKDKWEKKTKSQLVLNIHYGQFLRVQEQPIEFQD